MIADFFQSCCIDEASSGIDPIARRKVWDILLAERGQRSFLFTTHFLDEAEVLSDYVAILSKGILKAEGSVASLKNRLGGGYRVILGQASVAPQLQRFPNVTRHIDYGKSIFEVTDQSTLSPLVSSLEKQGFKNYRIQGPTIENVFLAVTDEMRGDSDLARELLPGTQEETGDSGALLRNPTATIPAMNLNTGKGCSPLKQVGILFFKRITILKHNFMPYVAALFVSLVVAGMVTRFYINTKFPNGAPCVDPNDTLGVSFTETLFPDQLNYGEFTFGPPSINNTLQRSLPNDTGKFSYHEPPPEWGTIPVEDTLADFTSFISTNSKDLFLGGFFDDANTPTFAWHGSPYASPGPLFLQSLFNGVLMNQTLIFSFRNFKESFTPTNDEGFLVAIFTALGFAIYPGLFALYPTLERLRKVRAMQYSNGILSSSLWLAYLLFDLMFIVLISVLTTAIWASQYSGWYGLGYMFVVFLLYGLAATAFSYVVSLFVSSQIAAIAFTAVIQVIIAVLYFMA